MEYNKTYESFIEYTEKCKELIKRTFFTKEDTKELRYSEDSDIVEIVRNHRLKMIDIKLEHTMRMVEQIIQINEILELKVDLGLVIKVAVLYHDIGRFRQSTWSNTFSDRVYLETNKPFNNHGEDGYNIFMNEDFNVTKKYIPIIGQTILRHQDYHLEPKLNYRYNSNLSNINIDDIVTGKVELNEAEWQIASLIVQLVADIDKADILYQHLTDSFEMIKDYILDNSLDNLDNIAKYWGVSKNEIIKYNKIDEKNYIPKRIMIPIANMPLEKLDPPVYMKKMFYENSWPELNVINKDRNWTFISILWWRLSHFLNGLIFTSTLINIEEKKLLEQIYEKIPDRLKPLVSEAFLYAQEKFVEEKINDKKGSIFLK